MLVRFLKFLIPPLFILLSIIVGTLSDLRYETGIEPTPLTEAQISHVSDLSFDRHYRLAQAMAFKLPVSFEDSDFTGTLFWPTPPFNKLAVLVAGQNLPVEENLGTEFSHHYDGRLVRCVQFCRVAGVTIDMQLFLDKILIHFPEYKESYSKLPSIILDTTVKPKGLKFYLDEHRIYFQVFFFSLIICMILYFKKTFSKEKIPEYDPEQLKKMREKRAL